MTDKILKKSCTVEAAKDLLNSAERFRCAMETIVFVTEVPMFAPIMIGIAFKTVKTPPPTIPTTTCRM